MNKPDYGQLQSVGVRDCRETSPADHAYGAAHAFVKHLAMVSRRAREYHPRRDKPDAWQSVAFDFADAFIAWFDLTHLLTPAVRSEARRMYPPGAASIKVFATPCLTVIEALANELGGYFRNAVYVDRRHPLEPDRARLIGEAKETRAAVRQRLGIKNYGDAQDLMVREWNGQDRARGETALYLLQCDSIDFAELRVQLIREAEAVIAKGAKAKKKRKRAAKHPPRKMTEVEIKTMAVVLNHGGNVRAAAKQMGKAPQTVDAAFKRAMKKTRSQESKSRSVGARAGLPVDRRGQENLTRRSEDT